MKKAETHCLNYTRILIGSVKHKLKLLKSSTQDQIDKAHKTNAVLNNTIDEAVTKGYKIKEVIIITFL